VNEGAARQKDQDRQPSAGKFSDEHGIKDIGDVFEEEGPGRTVQRVHFRPSAHIQGNGNGQQRESHGHDQQHFPYGSLRKVREDFRPLEVKEDSPQQHPHDHHGLKAHQPPLAEVPQVHFFPAVVIGVSDDEAGQHEEEALVNEGAARQKDQDRQPSAGKFSDEHGIKDIGDVFEEEGPGRTVQRVHFRPSAHIQGNGNGQQRESHGHDQQHFPYGSLRKVREDFRPLEVKEDSPQQHPHDHHGLKAHQPPLAEVPQVHFFPAVVIGVSDDEAGQHEEEVHGQVAVVDDLVRMELEVPGAAFKHVEQDHHDGGHPAEAVQSGVVRFGSQDGGRGWSAHSI